MNNPRQFERLAIAAANKIMENYSPEKMASEMYVAYKQILPKSKRTVNFTEALGDNPFAWYKSCQANQAMPAAINMQYASYTAMENSKGSLQHFLNYFPKDAGLKQLASTRQSI